MGDFVGLAIIAGIVIVIIIALSILQRYRSCPPDKILVIYGKVMGGNRSAKCIHGGGTFVWPLIRNYSELSMTPMTINIPLQNALSKQNIRINVPSTFTVGISPNEAIMANAAEKLGALSTDEIERMAKEIIFGQLRLVVASLTIEQINQDRESFLSEIKKNLDPELNKIGLYLINVNITDITDASNYIESIGKKAASEAIEQAKVDVAEQEKLGAIGEAKANKERAIEVAKNRAEAEKGEKEAEADRRIFVQNKEAEAVIGEADANSKKTIEVSKKNAEAAIGEADANSRRAIEVAKKNAATEMGQKNSESERRIYVQQKEAEAIEGENASKASIILSNSKLLIAEAEARKNAEIAVRNSQTEINKAQYYAELERLNAEQIVLKEIEKKKIELDAQAEAARISTEAKGQAEAVMRKYEAEAEGIKKVLAAKADGYAQLLKSVNNDSKALSTLLMVEKIENIVDKQVEAIKNIKIDKITVWDSGDTKANGSSTTSNFVSSFAKALPPLQDIAGMAGIELPSYLGHVDKDKKAKEEQIPQAPVNYISQLSEQQSDVSNEVDYIIQKRKEQKSQQ